MSTDSEQFFFIPSAATYRQGVGKPNPLCVGLGELLGQPVKKLTSDETERLIRFCKVLVYAIRVFGSKEKALQWLNRVHPELSEDLAPSAFCQSEEGVVLVQDLLNAIEHGFSA